MLPVISALLAFVAGLFRSRASLCLEHLALRHQLAVYQQAIASSAAPADRSSVLGVVVSSVVGLAQRPGIRAAAYRDRLAAPALSRPLATAEPARHAWPSHDCQRASAISSARCGRRIRRGAAPRIVGELRKLGIDVAKSTVEKYRMRPQKPPSPTWKTFLKNHVQDLVALDFFVVPTVTHKVLFVLLILAHERRRVVHFNITEHPTAQWTAQQVIEAFPWDEAPRYLLRDRDQIYGASFRQRVQHMGIEEVLIAPRSPWQNPYVERLIGSIRRECLDHVIVLHERHLQAAPDRLLSVLSSLAHAPGAGHGLSCATAGPTAGGWLDPGSPRSGWVASSL